MFGAKINKMLISRTRWGVVRARVHGVAGGVVRNVQREAVAKPLLGAM